jgi:hypothetical protein
MSMSKAPMDRGPIGTAHPLSEEAAQLIERQIRRNIQYRWIFRQNTVRLCTSRPPAEGQRKDAARPWHTRREPDKVHGTGAHGPRPTRDSTPLI